MELQMGDYAAGKIRQPILRHEKRLRAAQFNPDGSIILTGDDGGTIRRWNAQSGAPSGPSVKLPGAVVAFSRDGNRAVSGPSLEAYEDAPAMESDIRVWNLNWNTGKASPLPLKAPGSRFVSFSDDGQRL